MFDPYRKWLGIPQKDQPPNHYRLLGLERFESDLDVIEGAADRQMGFVRQYQSGEHAADAARILNELAKARLCLLKPATKAAYDAELRQQLSPAEMPSEFPEDLLTFADDLPSVSMRKKKRKPTAAQPAVSPQLLMIGGGAAVVCLLLVFVMSRRGGPVVPKPVEPVPTDVANSGPSKVDTTQTTTASAKAGGSDSVVWQETKLGTEPAGPPVDLVKLVDLERDVAAGQWEKTSTALISEQQSQLFLPTSLPDDYQLKFVIRRIEGIDALLLGFMMSGRQGVVAIDGWSSTASGLYVDGYEANANSTTRRGKLFNDMASATIVLTVHPGHLHLAFDDTTIIDWFGDPKRLYAERSASRESPFLIAYAAKYVIESASLIPLKPEPALIRIARLEHEVDVLPLLDMDRDAVQGIWGINKGTLHSPEGWGKIYLPTVVPEEYTVSATVELPAEHQGDYALTFGLIAGQSNCQFTSTGGDSGLDMIDGRRWNGNETRMRGLLKPGIPARVACTVTKDGIRIGVDGRTLVDWPGDTRRLSIPGEWALADGRRLSLGSIGHLKFRDIKLGPPLPAPKTPDHPPLTIGQPLDLLALIDTARDAINGTWERDGAALRCMGELQYNMLAFPMNVPDEYKLTLRVAREDGAKSNNECLFIGLPMGSSRADVTIDGFGSTVSGVNLDFHRFGSNPTARQGTQVIPSSGSHEIVVVLRQTGLQVTCDGNPVIDWTGNPHRLSGVIARGTPGRCLMVGSYQQRMRFEELKLEPLPPTSFPPVAPLGADGKLLPIIHADRDARLGDWKLAGDALTCHTRAASRLNIPAPVPKSYVLSGTVERLHGDRQLNVGLLVDGHPCAIVIDADGMRNAGIDLLDGKRYFDGVNLVHRIYKSPLLPQNQRVSVRCVVLPDTILVTCGDKEVIRWHGSPRRLSMLNELIPPNDSEADWTHLFLGSWESGFAFRDLELKPLSDAEAKQLSDSFSGVFPTTPQKDAPFATTAATVAASDTPKANNVRTNSPSTPSASRQPLRPAKLGEWTDLLDWAEGLDWAPRGINWNDNIEGPATRDGIRIKSAPFARFPLPAIIDGDYEMEVEFNRHEGEEAVAVCFPVGIRTMRLLLGTEAGTVSHVSFVDEKEFGERRPAPITNDQPQRVVIRVHHDGSKAGFHIDWDNFKDYIQWEGAETALWNTDGSGWRTNMIEHPWIGASNSDVTFQKVRVRMISGTIRRDFITAADREQDLKDGFVRLVGVKASGTSGEPWTVVVNEMPLESQLPAELRCGALENQWPLISRDFTVCDDFYGAHALSRLKCPIPTGAKSFSVIGYNHISRSAKYQLLIDGKQVYDSGITGVAVIKVDIPSKSKLLEMIIDPAGKNNFDHTYWCFPRFHSIPTDRLSTKLLDGKPGPLKFSIASSTAEFELTHNKPLSILKSVPIHFNDVVPCHEFLFAHAPSTVTYQVPEGMTRFTAIGYNVLSHHVKYEVWSGGKRIYESPEAGIIPIDVKLPIGTKAIDLKVDHLGNLEYDHSMWCYPRLYRK